MRPKGGRRAPRASAATLFKQYNQTVTSSSQQAELAELPADPQCCCCPASYALIVCNTISGFLSVALLLVGVFINNEVSGWGLRAVDMVGNLCLSAGVVLLGVSMLGVMAARTRLKCAPPARTRASRTRRPPARRHAA